MQCFEADPSNRPSALELVEAAEDVRFNLQRVPRDDKVMQLAEESIAVEPNSDAEIGKAALDSRNTSKHDLLTVIENKDNQLSEIQPKSSDFESEIGKQQEQRPLPTKFR